ncbi:hypothetical protein J2Z35_002794 [Acetoanaerobium pronyense]|uniref:Copper amine oxidase-like N-terminal domain-containing protein n=1 Tax=Acetoanaerobium pronyense TaxID=1482736 RepID=A0ABS4KP24_9FIRM|nr:copper amine oxidase N-terminal domain-containing protein [Acetoanaerobium pronyense]MBP2028956.1 hypothetical protein [Acetoanaerobium pronyense]
MKRLLKSKRITAGILFAAITSNMLGTLAYGVTSSNEVYFNVGEPSYLINGVEKKMDSAAIIHNSRTMVPMRYAAEAFGAKVKWSQETRTATIIHGEKEIRLPLDENVIYAGDKVIEMDTKAVVIEGRTMLPLAYIAQSLGLETSWNGETRTVKIMEPVAEIEYDENLESKVFDKETFEFMEYTGGQIGISIGLPKVNASAKYLTKPKGEPAPTGSEILERTTQPILKKGENNSLPFFEREFNELVEGTNVLYILAYDIDGVKGTRDVIVAFEFEIAPNKLKTYKIGR